jgi:hypothetical protein
MEFLQNLEGERAGHCKGEVIDEHSISEGVCINSGRSYLMKTNIYCAGDINCLFHAF